jgi:hypothetical protein
MVVPPTIVELVPVTPVPLIEPAAPPPPTVMVIAEPRVTAYPVAVNKPPAPPPPEPLAPELPVPPPPPPATTRYSTVVTGELMPSSPTERMPPTLLRDMKASYQVIASNDATAVKTPPAVPDVNPTD